MYYVLTNMCKAKTRRFLVRRCFDWKEIWLLPCASVTFDGLGYDRALIEMDDGWRWLTTFTGYLDRGWRSTPGEKRAPDGGIYR